MISKEIITSANLAASWLVNAQEKDGNFLLIMNLNNLAMEKYDHPRSAFSGWSLGCFGQSTKNKLYLEASRNNFNYFCNHLDRIVNDDYAVITLSYVGLMSLFFKNEKIAFKCFQRIWEKKKTELDFIASQIVIEFLMELSKIDIDFEKKYFQIADKLKYIFEESIKNQYFFQPGLYAELLNIFPKIYDINKNERYLQFSKWLADWFLKNQFSNGAFKINVRDKTPDSRKTGKIAESLASFVSNKNLTIKEKEKYMNSLKKSVNWILSMQYRKKNGARDMPMVIGGIQHTNYDSNIWIDSVAHFILATARLSLNKNS